MSHDFDQRLGVYLSGPADLLIADRDGWYTGAATMLGREVRPWRAPDDAEDACSQILERIAIDCAMVPENALVPVDLRAAIDAGLEDRSLVVGHAPMLQCGNRIWLTSFGQDAGKVDLLAELANRTFAASDLPPLAYEPVKAADAARIAEALQLLGELLPHCAANTLPLVHLIVVHRSPIVSMQLSSTPQTIYLGDQFRGRTVLALADSLLHEALHEKSALLRRTRFLMCANYAEGRSPTVLLPWSADTGRPRNFSAWRLLSAAHVYVHLALLHARAGSDEQAFDMCELRATFMLAALASGRFESQLGPDGVGYIRLLTDVVAGIDYGKAGP